jgi:hypothetical protein
MVKSYDSGKGSKQRPTNYGRFSEGWDQIFKNKYQDSLSTQECVIDAIETLEKEKNNKSSKVKK